MNLLFISAFAPYDKVNHAGGKTHNYYIKRFAAEACFSVRLISFAKQDEIDKLDCDKYGIESYVINTNAYFWGNILRKSFDFICKRTPFDRYAGFKNPYYSYKIWKFLRYFRKTGYNPDVIIFEWTQMIFEYKTAHKIFPNAKLIASEHDVSYLGEYRRYQSANGCWNKWKEKIRYQKLFLSEIKALRQMNLVLPHNFKDKELLLHDGLKRTKVSYINPYFDCFPNLTAQLSSHDIIFYGAMSRPENSGACIWFVKKVLPYLLQQDNQFRFIIVGGNPTKEICNLQNEHIFVTGFVEKPEKYFSNALCMVAPLLLGAGIKVKILEGMSAGLPVITNQIGIEGIPAKNREEFFLCHTADDYMNVIMELSNNSELAKEISKHAKIFIKNNFDLNLSYQRYKKKLIDLLT